MRLACVSQGRSILSVFSSLVEASFINRVILCYQLVFDYWNSLLQSVVGDNNTAVTGAGTRMWPCLVLPHYPGDPLNYVAACHKPCCIYLYRFLEVMVSKWEQQNELNRNIINRKIWWLPFEMCKKICEIFLRHVLICLSSCLPHSSLDATFSFPHHTTKLRSLEKNRRWPDKCLNRCYWCLPSMSEAVFVPLVRWAVKHQ